MAEHDDFTPPMEPEPSRTSFGPEFAYVPALSMRRQPGRTPPLCPLCGEVVNVLGSHAVVVERWDGRMVAGRYAHVACASLPLTPGAHQ